MAVLIATHDDQTLQGGNGTDTLSIAPLLGVDRAVLNGGGGSDIIDSTFGHDITLNGQSGDDLLQGHDGDHFIGGSGVDLAIVDLTGTDTAVSANLSKLGSTASVAISNATIASVEVALIALGDGNDQIVSSARAEVGIYGGGGDDQLTGKGAIDLLAGGAGSDLIQGGGGADLLFGFAPGDMFGFDIPGLGSDDGTGHDTLLGGGGADVLTGSLGDDRLDGGTGLDTASYANATGGVDIDLHHATQATGGAGTDVLKSIENIVGGSGNDHIVGSEGANLLVGGDGDDTLDGAGGVDVLTGGAGSDHFVFSHVNGSLLPDADAIVDLGDADVIDLAAIDADTGTVGDQAFHLVDHLSGQAGELTLTYQSDLNQTVLVGDTDGDGLPDLVVDLNGDHRDFANFVL